jgi:hypothetical protein
VRRSRASCAALAGRRQTLRRVDVREPDVWERVAHFIDAGSRG